MFIALVIVTVLLAAMAAGSAAKKLQKDEQVRTIIGGTVGVPERHFTVLAALELAGAAGILIGLWLPPLGIAAAAGLVLSSIGDLSPIDYDTFGQATGARRRQPRYDTEWPDTSALKRSARTRLTAASTRRPRSA